jgi:tripartite-type tricarboxylate transporter receptor subunit TctC
MSGVHSEPRAIATLWIALFVAAVGVLMLNLLRNPGAGGQSRPLLAPLTFWITDAQADSDTSQLAAAASTHWQLGQAPGSVGMLPGKPAQAIDAFLRRTATPVQAPGNLLVLTSTTLSQLDGGAAAGPTAHASVVAVLATDPLELAVKSSSSLHSVAQALARVRMDPSHKVFGVANDGWLVGNLAALVPGQGLHGRAPYTLYSSSADAIAGLTNGAAQVVLAPRSTLSGALAAHRVRLLRWPHGRTPQAWIALVAPRGLSTKQLAALRRHGQALTAEPAWRRLLRADGLRPADVAPPQLTAFLRDQLRDARRLHALTARFVQS